MSDCREGDPVYPSSRLNIDHFLKLAALGTAVVDVVVAAIVLSKSAFVDVSSSGAVLPESHDSNKTKVDTNQSKPTALSVDECDKGESKTKHCILRDRKGRRCIFSS